MWGSAALVVRTMGYILGLLIILTSPLHMLVNLFRDSLTWAMDLEKSIYALVLPSTEGYLACLFFSILSPAFQRHSHFELPSET